LPLAGAFARCFSCRSIWAEAVVRDRFIASLSRSVGMVPKRLMAAGRHSAGLFLQGRRAFTSRADRAARMFAGAALNAMDVSFELVGSAGVRAA